jgi:hypothetical protein
VSKKPEVVARREAMIGKVHVVEVEPGTKIFNLMTEELLGVVYDGHAIPYPDSYTVYVSVNDYETAKAALPAAPKPSRLPGLH